VLDSSGNYAGGFYYGQNLRPANPQQCYDLNEELNQLIASNFNEVYLNASIIPFFVQLVNIKYVMLVEMEVSFQVNCNHQL